MSEAIKKRNNHGLTAYRRGEVMHRLLQAKGLDREQHDVKGRIDFPRLDQAWGNRKVAGRADNSDPRSLYLIRPARPNQKRNVSFCLDQTRAEVATNCARSYDKN